MKNQKVTEQSEAIPDALLIVDDDEMNSVKLKEIFKDAYQIEEAENGEECLFKLQNQIEHICALLLNATMPVKDGIALLEKLWEQEIPKKIPMFLITEEENEKILKTGYELGIMDVIEKPVVPYVVRRRVDSAVELFLSRKKMRCLVESQKRKLIEKEVEIMDMNKGMISALATAIEFRSGESGEHVRRISEITRYLLTHTPLGEGISEDAVEQISVAAILHDVGKIAILDSILNKPGKLTPEEYEIMKTHTVQGAQLLERIPQLKSQPIFRYAYDIARHHHERWDGGGYPDGLKGEEISVWTQVVSLADVYDALVSKRVYKEAFEFDEAVQMIVEGKCGAFNPEMIQYFLRAERELRKFYG